MQKNREITTILTEIEAHTKMVNTVIDTVPVVSRIAIGIGIRQSQDALVVLREEYKSRLLSNTVGFFLFGDSSRVKEFARLSHENSGTINVDALEMYRDLAANVAPSMGSRREFNVDQFTRLVSDLRQLMLDLKVQEFSVPSPEFKRVQVLETDEDLTLHIRDLIRSSIGDWLNNLYISSKLVDKALAVKYSVPVLVCTVSNATLDEEQAMTMFNVKHNLTLDSENQIDPTFISTMYAKYSKKKKANKND